MVKRYNTIPEQVKNELRRLEEMGYTEAPSPIGLLSYCDNCEEQVMLVIKKGSIAGECPKCNNKTGNLSAEHENTGFDWSHAEE